MSKIIKKIKFLIFCCHKGHNFGVVKYLENGEIRVCARCGYTKTRKFAPKQWDDYEIY